jgi:hypothetical protein
LLSQTAIIFSRLQAAYAFANSTYFFSYKSSHLSSPSFDQRSEFGYGNSGKEIEDFLGGCHSAER